MNIEAVTGTLSPHGVSDLVRKYAPGLLVATTVAMTAQFLSEHYGVPAMLMALLLGIAFHFLAEEGRCVPGIDFTARTILRLGVALLGMRISFGLLVDLGAATIALIIGAVIATILLGLLGARLLGRGWRLALLTGGSVAICGASAAMAIAAVLPRNEHSERNLLFTVMGVTVLSTIAMVLYPIIAQQFTLDDREIGIFIGGTIHDVAQVVGAGFSVSQEAGDTATLVKLIRVTMLAPVVLVFALIIRALPIQANPGGARPPLIPAFVLSFLILAAINSFGLVPEFVSNVAGDASRWALLIAISAVGMKSSLKRIFDVGGQAITLIVAETVFIGIVILVGIAWLGGGVR
ncbi:MAG: putative sulfate exporter family transporter [Pseudomonadota bacterium]